MRMTSRVLTRLAAQFCAASFGIAAAADIASTELDRRFTQTVRPFLNQYCMGCHGSATPAAQFDLRPYTTMASVVNDLGHWNHVLERLSAKDMPPKQMPQPAATARQEVIDWVTAVRLAEAKRNAGDPGNVLARRLSNAEYNNTIRDLTGVDIRPTREFPVDPANTAGFDNSGESLSMSPALLNKYLQAAREVGDHMVLTQDGFDFSPHPMLVETDREKYAIKRIVDFYFSQPTDYADYFQAAWRYKNRAALGKPASTLSTIASDAKLSQKYLPMVWQILTTPSEPGKPEVGPMQKLQLMFRALPAPGGKPEQLRQQCEDMRNFVVRLRKHTAMEFAAPVVRGLSPTSQPLMNWKFKQFVTHRRDFDRKALRLASDPPLAAPTIPRYPGLGQESAGRAAALMLKSRVGDQDLIIPEGASREAFEKSFARFSSVFPDVFFVSERGRFFPDDSQDKGRLLSAGYHNVMGYYRDDLPLVELILDDKGKQHLDRLWDEFDFIGDHTTRTWIQYFFNQSGEVQGNGRESGTERPPDKAVTATAMVFQLRDAYVAKAQANPTNDPIAVEAINEHFARVNETMRRVEKMRQEAAPHHTEALLKFASRAFRRPLTKGERDGILAYYQELKTKNSLTHEDAMRDSIVSILMSPKFSYRIDLLEESAARRTGIVNAAATTGVKPLSGYALASRLSYFLWSSMPDGELMERAGTGDLKRPDVLAAQARRMLKDPKARGIATEFAGNWLDFRRFEDFNSVDRERFPAFTNELREAMFQEPVRFVEDVIRKDRPVLDMLYGKDTFVNPALAKHYGMPNVEGGANNWVKVDNARNFGRGGILAMSVFLTQNSPGLRTSPVKRGYWVAKRVLGENIPPPPPQVPELPTDEAKSDLPLREMLAKHRDNPACASCHARFDSFGLVFENYGPIGEKRDKDLAGRPVDTQAQFPGGGEGNGFAGVEAYIREHRQKDFIDNLSRKLLAYALGRSLQLSDELVVDRMKASAATKGFRFAPFIETIVTSPQFLNKRFQPAQEQKGE